MIATVERIVAALDPDAAGAGAALLMATAALGFDPAVARKGITAELAAWRAPGAIAALAARAPTTGRAPRTVLVIGARTLPVSTLRQVLIARLVGAQVAVKAARGQEAIALALAAADPGGIIAAPFTSDAPTAVRAALDAAEAVVVLGSDETVSAVRREYDALGGARAFVGYGHRVSAGWIGPEASDAELAGLAEDVVAWDGAGCLAPKVFWSEGPPEALAKRLGEALLEASEALPLAAAHALHAARVEALMRGGRAFGGARAGVGTRPDAALAPVPAPRWVWVVPADARALAAALPVLSTLAVGGAPRALPATADAPGLRRCAPGEMQRPGLDWRQDGYDPLAAIWLSRYI